MSAKKEISETSEDVSCLFSPCCVRRLECLVFGCLGSCRCLHDVRSAQGYDGTIVVYTVRHVVEKQRGAKQVKSTQEVMTQEGIIQEVTTQ